MKMFINELHFNQFVNLMIIKLYYFNLLYYFLLIYLDYLNENMDQFLNSIIN